MIEILLILLTLTPLLALTPHQARRRPVGSDIVLEGHVTAPSGAFRSFMNDNGFVLGDQIDGIYVATDDRGYRSHGSAVEVTGRLTENARGMLVLRARSIHPRKGRSLFKPWPVEGPALDEFYEGKTVQAEGEVARAGSTTGPSQDDRLFLRRARGPELRVLLLPGAKPDAALLAPGQRLRVTGFCAQDNQVYEIVVRSAKDIKTR